MTSAATHAAPLAGHGHASGHSAEDEWGKASTGKLGMWIFLICDAFSFFGLLLNYALLRSGGMVWHHPGEPSLGINFTAGLTFLLICSSVTMVLAYAAAVEGNRTQLCLFLLLTILGGIGFLAGQYHEYSGLIEEGLIFGHSAYASTFYVTTSFHGAHVLTGVIYLSTILIGALQGRFDKGNYNGVELVGLFWHFVDLIWILVFTIIYLIP
jgi:heme/copper-type cytochrome/quinol oxidase subunit 3